MIVLGFQVLAHESGLFVLGWVGFFFVRGRVEIEEGRAGLCNHSVHWDNNYLVFNQEGVHRNVLAQFELHWQRTFQVLFTRNTLVHISHGTCGPAQ